MSTEPKKDPVSGPAFGYDAAAEYLNCSRRQIQVFEEQGELQFFTLGPKMKRTTKAWLDRLLDRAWKAYISKVGEGEK